MRRYSKRAAIASAAMTSSPAGVADRFPATVLRRLRGYRAVAQVERYRPEAERLRRADPQLCALILEQSKGSQAEAAAARDPDAYGALYLANAGHGVVAEDERGSVEEDRLPPPRLWLSMASWFCSVTAYRTFAGGFTRSAPRRLAPDGTPKHSATAQRKRDDIEL